MEFPNLKYVRQPNNLGVSGNRNWLGRQPTSEYIAKLDSDDYYEPAYLARLTEVLKKYPAAGYAHCAVTEVDESSSPVRARRLNRAVEYIESEQALREAAKGYRVSANIIVFRRSALEQVGFWRSDMIFAEDWDLAVRLADAGWGNCYVPDILANYRVWGAADGYRQSRKISEVNGICRVFDDDLLPAFARRGWDSKDLLARRQQFAVAQAGIFFERQIEGIDRQNLEGALRKLGASRTLELYLRLSRAKPIAAVYVSARRVKLRLKDGVKRVLANFYPAKK